MDCFSPLTELTWLFWIIQIIVRCFLFGADMAANAFGVKKFGGTKAGVWGSTIGFSLVHLLFQLQVY